MTAATGTPSFDPAQANNATRRASEKRPGETHAQYVERLAIGERAVAWKRPQSLPLEGTAWSKHAIQRVSYTHDAMIDLILLKPEVTQREIAAHFNLSEVWISRVRNSDAFLARLAQRKSDLIDPMIVVSFEEKMRSLADISADIVAEKLEATRDVGLAFKALEMSTRALGYGARQQPQVANTFVVAMPTPSADATSWAAKHTPGLKKLADPPVDAVEVVVEQSG